MTDLCQKNARPAQLVAEGLHRAAQTSLEEVVSEHHHHLVSIYKTVSQAEGFCDATWSLLVGVEELADPILAPVAQQTQELTRMRAPVTSIRSSTPAFTSASIA